MDAIRIHRCRLRVVRHGGWSWGSNPRQLVDQATQRLPAWLMRALAAQLADAPADLTIRQLRLCVPVRLSELGGWAASPAEPAAQAATGALTQRVQDALARALSDAPRQGPAAGPEADPTPAQLQSDAASPTAITDTLIAWQRAGEMPRMFAVADAAALRVWARVLVEELAGASPHRACPASPITPLVARLEALLGAPDEGGVPLRQALLRLVEALTAPPPLAAGALPVPSTLPDTPQPPGSAPPPGSPPRFEGAAPQAGPAPRRSAGLRDRMSPARQPRRASVAVESVLPFIVTGILARRKYFEALRAALVCVDQLEHADCFAAALAYKLSPPPHRGWDRGLATRRLAAAMCGQDEPPDNARMVGFLKGLSSACAPLDASLWPADRPTGRRPGILVEPLEGGCWAVLDIASSQPLGWFRHPEDVLRMAELLPRCLWWLALEATDDASLAEAFGRRGQRAVALGAPPRAAGWRRAGDMLWTNEPLLRQRGAGLRHVFDEARDVLAATHSEFVEMRPLVLPAVRGAARLPAEVSITLAVCSALGELADTLWREREPPQPLLALRRLGDLGGTVSVEEGRVRVRPALGRRFMDLAEHGLLRDIVGVPWWPGRRVEFAGP